MGELAALMAGLVWVATVPVATQGPSTARANGGAAKVYTPARNAGRPARPVGVLDERLVYAAGAAKNVTKEFYTPEEMKELAAAERRAAARQAGSVRDVHYDNEQFGVDKSLTTFPRSLRTSLIVDPPRRQDPPQIPEAVKRMRRLPRPGKSRTVTWAPNGPSAIWTPCRTWAGTSAASSGLAWRLRSSIRDLSNYQIIQSPGFVTILSERLFDARIIPLDARPFPPSKVRSWRGISGAIGRATRSWSRRGTRTAERRRWAAGSEVWSERPRICG